MEELNLSTIDREELEAFTAEALVRMNNLESTVQRLEEQLQVDPDVIDGWRDWCATVEDERKKWADTATELERKLKAECKENSRLFQAVKDLTIGMERIHDAARRVKNPKARTLDLKRAIDSIHEQAGAAMADAYEEVLGYPEDVNDNEAHLLYRSDRVRLITSGETSWASPNEESDQQYPRPQDAEEQEAP
jgi:hypothetical protein